MAQTSLSYQTYLKKIAGNKFVRSYSSAVFSLVTISILIVFAIRPTVTTILNLQKEIDNQKKVLEALNNKAQSLTEAKQNFNKLSQADKLKISQAVPVQVDVPSLVKNLEASLAQQASSSALQVQPIVLFDRGQTPNFHPQLGQVEFTYNVEGTYKNLLSALNNIASSPRVVGIDSVALRKQEGTLIMSVNGKAYFVR